MTKGKPWTPQEEAQLSTLAAANMHVEEIAQKLEKTPGAVFLKCHRLGLKLQSSGYTDTAVSIPHTLPSIEETMKVLAGALKAAVKPGLNRVEVQRLQTVSTIAKTYKELLSDYINYRSIEDKLNEMEEQNARLLREIEQLKEAKSKSASSDSTSQPNSAPVA